MFGTEVLHENNEGKFDTIQILRANEKKRCNLHTIT